jgi:(4-(4-[2-(gamma-L-glutamylamino)ethyl]phenoxymethyl)furan-2-yl)methanamine synthase
MSGYGILGLDIGGANLKAASSDRRARTLPFPLWKQPEQLSAALHRLCDPLLPYDALALTMTGELCDCFAAKRDGVLAILHSVRDFDAIRPICVWTTQGRFVDWDEAVAEPLSIAAANWLALAHLVARAFPHERALLIDAGSTTTDLVYLNHGLPEPRGRTDVERLAAGELVYAGVRRTPVCAVLGMQVAAELFATMLDAYVFADLLPEAPDDHDSADGRPVTRDHAHARLARMRCADVESFTPEDARALADHALETQWQTIVEAVERVLRGKEPVQRVVLSGSGEVLGRAVAARHAGLAKRPWTSLSELLGPPLSEAACAYAVATLATDAKIIEGMRCPMPG